MSASDLLNIAYVPCQECIVPTLCSDRQCRYVAITDTSPPREAPSFCRNASCSSPTLCNERGTCQDITPFPHGFDAPTGHQVGGEHYKSLDPQPIELMRKWLSPDEFTGFCRGNVIKYIARYGRKGDKREQLLKARQYIDFLLDVDKP